MMALDDPISQKSKYQLNGPSFVRFLNTEMELALEDRDRITTLYKHQMEAALRTKTWFERDWNGQPPKPALIVAPTGSGKTGIVTLLPYVLGCPNVMILSPSPVISEQLAKAFGKYEHEDTFYVKTKMMSAERVKDYIENVNIIRQTNEVSGMTPASLVIINVHKVSGNSKMRLTKKDVDEVDNVREKFKSFTTIIVDEAHHYPADSWAAIIDIFRAIGKQIIFLTATPYRGENTPILGPDQEITYGILRQDIIGISIRDMAFQEIKEIQKYEVDSFSNEDINVLKQRISDYLADHDMLAPEVSHKAMILVWSKDSAENLANRLGNVASFYTSEDKRDCNKKLFEENDDIKILVVCGKLTEGYDNSAVSVCVILRKVQKRILFTQFIGRCQRLSRREDPVQAVVLSAPRFQQQQMYDRFDTIREENEML